MPYIREGMSENCSTVNYLSASENSRVFLCLDAYNFYPKDFFAESGGRLVLIEKIDNYYYFALTKRLY